MSGRPASLVRPSARLPPVRMPFQHSADAAQNPAKKIEGKGIDYFSFACYTPFTRGCSSSVELRLPKPIRWVRLPSSAPEKAGPSRVSPFLALRGVECVIAHAIGHVHEPAQTLANSSILFPVSRKGNRMNATPIIRSKKGALPDYSKKNGLPHQCAHWSRDDRLWGLCSMRPELMRLRSPPFSAHELTSRFLRTRGSRRPKTPFVPLCGTNARPFPSRSVPRRAP